MATVLAVTTAFLVKDFAVAEILFRTMDIRVMIVLIAEAGLVCFLKAVRLFVALYGNDIKLRRYLEIYCSVTLVSIVIPYKLGEIFRIFCYGREIGNMLKGIIIVLLDRFMDTAALVGIVFVMWIFDSGKMNALTAALLFFLLVVFFSYLIFPELYRFWKKYLLRAAASRHKLAGLKALENLHVIYKNIRQIIEGRGIMLFCLSLVVWAVEIGFMLLINQADMRNGGFVMLEKYLNSVISEDHSVSMDRFVLVSAVILSLCWAVVKATGRVCRKEKTYERVDCL